MKIYLLSKGSVCDELGSIRLFFYALQQQKFGPHALCVLHEFCPYLRMAMVALPVSPFFKILRVA